MTAVTAYDFIRLVLEQEFHVSYLRFLNEGVLHYELTNLIELCSPLLKGLDETDHHLRYEVIETIVAYLEDH